MAIQKTKAYVLARIPLRETSWILTCLTESFGKVKGVVKGARKEKSPWLLSCELYTHANMIFYEKTKTNLHLITELSVLDSHEKLRRNFKGLAYAGYFSEILDQLLDLGEPHSEIFDLFQESILLLEKDAKSYWLLARAFEVQFLKLLGLLPRFSECVICRDNEMKRTYFSSKHGGILCLTCHERNHSGFQVSLGCVQAIQFLTKFPLDKAIEVKLGKQIQSELEQILKQFIEYRLDRSLRSLHFLSQVTAFL